VVWLRRSPTDVVLGYLYGVDEATVRRTRRRVVPVLESLGRATMRPPDPGMIKRATPDAVLAETPVLVVLVDTVAQAVQRPRDRAEAVTYSSGKKRRHPRKSQVEVEERDGRIVDMAGSVRGPTHDLTLLKRSGLLGRLPAGVGPLGDLGYVGIAAAHPRGLGATRRKQPRGKARPPEDVAGNRAFARRRVPVEHAIRRLRVCERLAQADRHRRRGHTARVAA
jgi:hypothetical protein